MAIRIGCVGRPGALLGNAIAEYEARASRYWAVEWFVIREERATRGRSPRQIIDAEAGRLLERVPVNATLIAMTRTGDAMSSERFARMLHEIVLEQREAVFVVGGAFGLGDEILKRAEKRLRLSTLTLPHDLARLVLAEQLYRAGTIVRGEPYHKARGGEAGT